MGVQEDGGREFTDYHFLLGSVTSAHLDVTAHLLSP